MSSDFRPLASKLPAAPAIGTETGGEFRARVIPRAEAPSAFQSIVPSRAAASAANPAGSPLAAAAAPTAAHAGHASKGEPKVTVQREGDRVTGIRIECGCGEVIELACVY